MFFSYLTLTEPTLNGYALFGVSYGQTNILFEGGGNGNCCRGFTLLYIHTPESTNVSQGEGRRKNPGEIFGSYDFNPYLCIRLSASARFRARGGDAATMATAPPSVRPHAEAVTCHDDGKAAGYMGGADNFFIGTAFV